MASFNRVILVGNLTRDVEVRFIPSGTAVTDLRLAVNDRRKNATHDQILPRYSRHLVVVLSLRRLTARYNRSPGTPWRVARGTSRSSSSPW